MGIIRLHRLARMTRRGNASHAGEAFGKIAQRIQRTMRHRDQPEGDPHYDENRFHMRHVDGYEDVGENCSTIFPDGIEMLEICSLGCRIVLKPSFWPFPRFTRIISSIARGPNPEALRHGPFLLPFMEAALRDAKTLAASRLL